jgi:hypothetical protein
MNYVSPRVVTRIFGAIFLVASLLAVCLCVSARAGEKATVEIPQLKACVTDMIPHFLLAQYPKPLVIGPITQGEPFDKEGLKRSEDSFGAHVHALYPNLWLVSSRRVRLCDLTVPGKVTCVQGSFVTFLGTRYIQLLPPH